MSGLSQVAFLTEPESFDAVLDFWASAFGAGPFYTAEILLQDQKFEGEPCRGGLRIALTFLGDTQVEIIAPTSDSPSPWREILEARPQPSAGAFHHVLLDTAGDLSTTSERLVEAGFRDVYEARLGATRVRYLDGRHLIGCFVELVDAPQWNEVVLERMRHASAMYDGTDPRRDYLELVREVRVSVPGAYTATAVSDHGPNRDRDVEHARPQTPSATGATW